jgi:DNA polymerase I
MLLLPVPHKAIWFVDTEYQHKDGERDQRPICLVAHEYYSGETKRLWEDELYQQRCAPFDVGPDNVVVVYGAFAELGTFRALGWPAPHRVLDLFPEFKRQTNDGPHKSGSLVAALMHYNLPHMTVAEKEANRRLILDQNTWTLRERRRVVDYCESDVMALKALLLALLAGIDRIEEAFLRSEYMCTIDAISAVGIPMDGHALRLMQRHWDTIKAGIITTAHQNYGTYPDGKWDKNRFADYLHDQGILPLWPTYEKTGALQIDGETLKEMAQIYPQLAMLREVRSSLGKTRPIDLDIGSDGRCRSAIYPFGTITSRNAPRKFPFSAAKWRRPLIHAEPGRAIAYLDYSGQEIGIAAAYSGDGNMQRDYLTRDFHLAAAIAFQLTTPLASATEQEAARDRAKALNFGLNYGMTWLGLAHRLNIGYAEAADLVARHRAAYPRFWAFSDATVASGMFHSRLTTPFGWTYLVTGSSSPRSLRNWQFQSGGAEMLRLATIALVAAGVSVAALIHDAILIEAAARDIEATVEAAKALMVGASEVVTGGFPLQVSAKVFPHGQRYQDKRGVPMWNRVIRMLREAEATA